MAWTSEGERYKVRMCTNRRGREPVGARGYKRKAGGKQEGTKRKTIRNQEGIRREPGENREHICLVVVARCHMGEGRHCLCTALAHGNILSATDVVKHSIEHLVYGRWEFSKEPRGWHMTFKEHTHNRRIHFSNG